MYGYSPFTALNGSLCSKLATLVSQCVGILMEMKMIDFLKYFVTPRPKPINCNVSHNTKGPIRIKCNHSDDVSVDTMRARASADK